MTTATTKIERSGHAIRAALAQLSPEEQGQLARARQGVFDGLWERDDIGEWHQL